MTHLPVTVEASVIIPVYKKGKRSDPANYRPVNHTLIVPRIMKRLVKDGLFAYPLEHELITTGQHGFPCRKSCSTYMTDWLNAITKTMRTGTSVMLMFSDMTKAFDNVPP